MNKKLITILCLFFAFSAIGQQEYGHESKANRTVPPSQRIFERPLVVDTIIPIPNIQYPSLGRTAETGITIPEVNPAKIRIVDKLDKIYPGYLKLGIGNYATPLGEFYYNTLRNRRLNMGIHANHLSSFGEIKGFAPSQFDNTSGHFFANYAFTAFKLESNVDYINHGYHFYGIQDSLDAFPADTFANRVQGIGFNVAFMNYPAIDSGKVLYKIKTGYNYFHEFLPSWGTPTQHARNSNFMIGSDFKYKFDNNLFTVDFNVRNNTYRYGESDTSIIAQFQRDDNNTIIQLKPIFSTYGKKWRAKVGVDINWDFPSPELWKVVPIVEGQYSLFNDIFIPYAGITGGVTQNTFQTINRDNPFIRSSIDLLNTREFNAYAGFKGTVSKKVAFDVNFHKKTFNNMPLYVNDTLFSDQNKFDVVYDRVDAFGIKASASYQLKEKLKIDLIASWTDYVAQDQEFAWNLAPIDITLRGSYNLFEKIYAKLDLNLLGGRKSTEGFINGLPGDEGDELGFIGDANLHLEYRYNKRISAFVQFNNLTAQNYLRYYRYPVQGFQVLGGVTFGF